MLVQSWGDTVRVFPAVPGAWQDAQIHNLRAQGAFMVSARRDGGRTEYVRVRSLASEPLKLAHSLEGPVTVRQVRVAPGGASPTDRPLSWQDLGSSRSAGPRSRGASSACCPGPKARWYHPSI
ncbi:glycoside hydrolase family 95-like protein [Streptomyces niveus]|uniref:glycoside hydrolase family 95-like protein n=1 Tax=Streptomyces niveus TaxID=193462 RepID=UPI00341A5DE3